MNIDLPRRIQRQRTKGWRMPENTVYVGRPTRWGNPFKVGGFYSFDAVGWIAPGDGCSPLPSMCHVTDALVAVKMYREYLGQLAFPPDFKQLRGKNLACWCYPGSPCHADVLLELANL